MASTSASASTGATGGSGFDTPSGSLLLSPTERTAFGYLFNLACPPDSGGILTAESAVAFFGKSALSPTTLGAIWALSDDKNNGFLDAKGFSLACRLIGHAQAGAPVDFRAASTPAPIPTMEGITIPGVPAAATAPAPSVDATPITVTPADRARYTRIFASAGPVNGLLDSDKAKDLFFKSNLPVDKLAAIWGLADTQQRGALDLTDFIIAMHFIQNTMNGSLQAIPAALPVGLYESANVGAPKPVGAQPTSPMQAVRQQSTGGSFTSPSSVGPLRQQTTGSGAGPFAGTPTSSVAALPRQLTGQFHTPSQGSRVGSPAPAASAFRPAPGSQIPGLPFGVPAPGVPSQLPTAASVIAAGSSVSPPWAVPAATIQRAATFFSQLDTTNTGLLNGASVVPFFMQSQLPEAALAQIWDLADVHQRGSLGLEEFSLAMHLIGESMAGKPLPNLAPGQSLPQELLPPSARGANLPNPVAQGDSDTQKDLFSLMDDDDDATSGALKAASALPSALKNATASTFVNPTASPPPSSAPRQNAKQDKGNFNAFDDDFFSDPMPGSASMSAQGTGSAVKSVRIADKPPSIIASPDTITSNLPPMSPPPGQSSNLAAVQDDSLRRDIDTQTTRKAALSTEATALENSIATDGASLSELEARLKAARASSDAEHARVATLRERAAVQSGELASHRAELISVESNLSALKMERDEVEQALMKEREDVREVRKRMDEARQQTEALKVEVEKLKKDLRKEKGLAAIARKQLSTAAEDKGKVEAELETARAEETGEDEAIHHHAEASEAVAPVDRAAALSPTGSVRSNNPFDRLNLASPPPAASSPVTERDFLPATETTHSSTGNAAGSAGVLGLAAGAGAALAGIASAARAAVGLDGEATDEDSESEDEAPEQLQQDGDGVANEHGATAQTAFDDGFADSVSNAVTAPASGNSAPTTEAKDAFSSAFDDEFGADAGTNATADSTMAGFDDVFDDDFGDHGPSAATAPATATTAPTEAKDAFSSAFDDEFGANTTDDLGDHGPSATTAPVAATTSSTDAKDAFSSAFDDEFGADAGANATTVSTSASLDDMFDDDFDFVPSFSNEPGTRSAEPGAQG
ncbi:hypothetical protein CF327_g6015 [Tilletia walkeri]|uniref:Uncharacterized protein n=1 Tax=Tilletia walkeri TaxID=117179 RepID=A0A8X7N8A2_9BASI|nr:hypothetical protein CF327_g6015 [Tilletia walkeri]KAE8267355.1 hypothetical protein A4X09_0g5002 [Tilletia walkeri]